LRRDLEMARKSISRATAADLARAKGGRIRSIDISAIADRVFATSRRQCSARLKRFRTTISTLRNNDWLGPGQPIPTQTTDEIAQGP